MRTIHITLIGTMTFLLALSNQAPAQQGKTMFHELPDVVKNAVKKAAPDCRWEDDDGAIERTSFGYFLSGKDRKKFNNDVRVIVNTAGVIYEVRVEDGFLKVPESVTAALRAQGFTKLGTYAVGPDTRTVVCYEFSGIPDDTRPRLTADGLLLTDAAKSAAIREKEQIPAAAHQAAEKAAPSVKWTFFASSFIESTPVKHILLGRDSQGRRVQAVYRDGANGALYAVSVAIPKIGDVPPSVLSALGDKAPGFRPLRADSVGPDAGSAAYYEFTGVQSSGFLGEDETPGVIRITADGLLAPHEMPRLAIRRPADVPAEIHRAADKIASGVKWNFAAAEFKGGKPASYLLMGRNSQGRRVQVVHDVSERITAFKTDVLDSDVPGPVRKALNARMPRFRPRVTLAVGMQTSKVTGYVFEGVDAEKAISVMVKLDGEVIPLESD